MSQEPQLTSHSGPVSVTVSKAYFPLTHFGLPCRPPPFPGENS
jgi:hypothetical protein